ncbi:MAG TPA: cytochrome o ubiquinol oxidase subunit IV [Candidatus Saccharimonadales bacterium]|nr:cytochrome o ubiquinol oxidase subunit IV [Candidatus Saccharimonadales bacterium]
MDKDKRTLINYIIGFILSLLLTCTAYLVVTNQLLAGGVLVAIIIGLAIAQVLVQLFFFLHLGHETKPRWKLVTLLFMLVVLFILVFGSLWIMQNLDYNMMPEHQVEEYMIEQNEKGF